jgi:hypothetical protein
MSGQPIPTPAAQQAFTIELPCKQGCIIIRAQKILLVKEWSAAGMHGEKHKEA